jgi:ABC-type cobalamin/Fe3+-siderophores transport system ATPase subunit
VLSDLRLQFGASSDDPPLVLRPGAMTVFVGPNNAGKSLALREIERYIEDGGRTEGRIISSIEPELPPPADARAMLLSRQVAEAESTNVRAGWVRVSRLKPVGEHSHARVTDLDHVPDEQLVDAESIVRLMGRDPEQLSQPEREMLFRDFFSLFTIRLDGRTRLALTQPRPAGDLQQQPSNFLVALFKDERARERIREITADAFGLYFVIDPTGVTRFRIRMAPRRPGPGEEQSLEESARNYHSAAADIAEMSDGVKAFTGLTAAVLSADYRVMLVDEPEAFLHPPLTRKLGRRLTQLAAERGASVIAATHSPDFLMGCIQAGEGLDIVRLTHRHGVATATLLEATELKPLMRNPLLRSTGVLSALFHEGAIVCEADADRVFYQEVNERLLEEGLPGADGCVFLNAQNKQTIRKIVQPLRGIGIPAAAMVDLDILKSADDLRELMQACRIPEALIGPWEEQRVSVERALRGDRFKSGGLRRLEEGDRQAARNLLDGLAEYGIFVVPGGELESWLAELEVGGHGPEWLTRIFTLMGTDPEQESYIHPRGADVWEFMMAAARWIADPQRKGMYVDTIPEERLLPAASGGREIPAGRAE